MLTGFINHHDIWLVFNYSNSRTTAKVAGKKCVFIHRISPTINFSRPFEKAVELRHKVVLVMSVDEAFPTVVHKPTRNVGPKHSVCPVVLLQASAGRTVGVVRTQTRRGQPGYLERRHTLPLCFLPPSSTVSANTPVPHPRSPSLPQVIQSTRVRGLV